MKAIKTRYLAATNTLSARIVAECDGNKVIISRCYSMEREFNEEAAVQALMDKMKWTYTTNDMVHGEGVKGETYWVFSFSRSKE